MKLTRKHNLFFQTCFSGKHIQSKCFLIIAAFSLAILEPGCKKFIDVPPPQTQLVSTSVFNNDPGAIAALSAIYVKMGMGDNFFNLNVIPNFSSDELTNYDNTNVSYIQVYGNSIISDNGSIKNIWTTAYNYIYQANAVLEGLNSNDGVSSPVKQQLLGEAKFVRAFCHFYLVNLFGDVPIVTSTDYVINSKASRADKADVYKQIITDLKDAEGLLSEKYLASDCVSETDDRLRPTKWAAAALLARAYLYSGDWPNAVTQSTMVIANSGQFGLVSDLNNVFTKNNNEAIWEVSGFSASNTFEGLYSILILPPGNIGPYALSPQILAAFENGDHRKDNWVGVFVDGTDTFYYPWKYKVLNSTTVTEYEMVLRFAEQYLIRAEAEAHANDITDAQNDLNMIRQRAGLGPTPASDQGELLDAILHERQVELFTEFGHRWLDLKRTGNVDAVMSVVTPLKGGNWNTNWQWYPIPQLELNKDANLVQNKGY